MRTHKSPHSVINMQLVGLAKLRKDANKYGDAAERGIESWIKRAENIDDDKCKNLIDLRKQSFNSADLVNGKTIFNIKGNSYRLITLIDYQEKIIAYVAFLTHQEYDDYEF